MPGTLSPQPSAGSSSDGGSSVDWPVGHVIDGQYEVKELIGKGGMGTVYRVRHWGWNVDLAVKVPLAHLVSDRINRERFILEAQTWIDLGLHPNITQCWFVRESERLPLLFLDYLALGSLKDWRKAGHVKPGEWQKILDLMIQACTGLGYAHERGLVHRDVKPANLLLREDDQLSGASGTFRSPWASQSGVRLCVTDFGLVKVTQFEPPSAYSETAEAPDWKAFADLSEGASVDLRQEEESVLSSLTLTATGTLLGTPEYGAPEQWTQARGVGIHADIYGLGGILFELCCGRRPFDDGQNRVHSSLLVGRHITKPAPDPRQYNPEIPPALAELILRCLEKRPDQRPASMAVVREELEKIYRDVSGKAYPRPFPRASTQRADALNNKAVSLWNLGFNQRAFDAWREALSLDALHPESVYNRSILQWRQAQIDEEEVLRRLTQIKVAYPHLAAYLGYFHLDRFSPEEAAQELDEALRYPLATREGSVWRALGDARMYLEDFAQAVTAYEEALERMPDDREARARLDMARKESRALKGKTRFPRRASRLFLERGGPITAVAITLDGRYALHAQDNWLEMWDLADGQRRWLWRPENLDHSKYTITRLWLTGQYAIAMDTPKGRIFSLESGQMTAELDGRKRFFDLGPGQKTALAGSDELELVSLPDLRILRIFIGHSKPIFCAALSEDGKMALSGSADRTIRVWNVETGECLRILEGHTDLVQTVAFSPDGALAISGSKDRTVRVWLLATGDCLRTLTHQDEVRRVRLTADSRFALVSSWSVGQKDQFDVWDLASGARLYTRPGGSSMSLLNGGPWVLVGSRFSRPGTLQLWEISSGRLLRTFVGHGAEITALTLGNDDRCAVTGSTDGSLRVWDSDWAARVFELSLVVNRTYDHSEIESTQQLFRTHFDRAEKHFEAAEYGHAYRQLTAARKVAGYIRDPRALALNGELLGKLLRVSIRAVWQLRSCSAGFSSSEPLGGVGLTPDGAFGLSAAGKLLHLWELSSGSCVRGFTGHSDSVRALCISSDGLFAVSASANGGLRVWNMRSGNCIHTMQAGKVGIQGVAITHDGTRLVFTSGLQMQIWGLSSGELVGAVEMSTPASCLSLSADGKLALTGSLGNGGLFLWDLVRSQKVRGDSGFRAAKGEKLPPEALQITALTLSSDGRYALTAGMDNRLRIWEMSSGECQDSWDGHTGRISAVALTGDGRVAVSAGEDGIRVWDVVEGTSLETIGTNTGPVTGVSLTPDGRFILAAGLDQALRLWELDWELNPETPAVSLSEAWRKSGIVSRITSLFRRKR